jgi:cobalt-zinc-cadmium efflux system outer membrane protein
MTASAPSAQTRGTRTAPRSRAVAFVACLAPLVSACQSVEPVTLTTQEASVRFAARSLDDPRLKRFAAQSATGFASWPPAHCTARALEVAALYFSPPLAVARAKWRVADAAIVTAGEIPNPSLDFATQYVSNAAFGVPAWVVAASLVQIVETAGKRGFRVTRARYLAEAARLDALDSAWETLGTVNEALLDIAIAERRITALERQIEALAALADIAEQRLDAGLGSSLALAGARSALSKAVLDREAARSALADARQRLARAVGLPRQSLPSDCRSVPLLADAPPPDLIQQMREHAILNRADLLARLASYAAADTALQLEAARQYPDVAVGPGYEYDQGSNKWGLSLGVELPIFNQHRGAIGEALAARRQAADEFLATQAQVIGEVDAALTRYQAAARSDEVAMQLLGQENDRLRAQQALFDRGEIDRGEFLAAKVTAVGAELAKTDAEASLARARLALEKASQYALNGLDPASLLTLAER